MNDHEKQLFDEQHTGTIKGSIMIKDPADWKTGDEPMTGAQHSYMETLSAEAGETFDESLTKAAASKKIEDLQQRTGRGADPE